MLSLIFPVSLKIQTFFFISYAHYERIREKFFENLNPKYIPI